MKFFSLLIFVLGLSTAKSSVCSTPIFGNVTVEENFNLTKFLGVWYEIEWLPSEPHNESERWRDFSQTFQFENGSTTRLIVFGLARILNETNCFSFGPWSIVANNSGKMILERQNLSDTTPLNWPYHVVKTDYENYALIFGCTAKNYSANDRCSQPIFWLFSRTTTLRTDHRTMIDTFIDETLCVNRTQIETTSHSDKSCFRSFASSKKISSKFLFILIFFLCFFT